MARTEEENVLFLILSEDVEGAEAALREFLPGELDDLETAADTLIDLIVRVRNGRAHERASNTLGQILNSG